MNDFNLTRLPRSFQSPAMTIRRSELVWWDEAGSQIDSFPGKEIDLTMHLVIYLRSGVFNCSF
ncbi:MAG: hypothetical protein U9O50_07335 [Acidobacteriota bacterium]|nr:hypothetical protein [Acidobacteriota bacterium]